MPFLTNKFIFLLTSCLLFSCASSKERFSATSDNKSHYHIHRFEKIQESDSASIQLAAFDLKDHRIGSFTIGVNEEHTYRSEANEPVILKLKPDNYYFRFKSLGYDSLNTGTFFIGPDDSLHIYIYLGQNISLHNQ